MLGKGGIYDKKPTESHGVLQFDVTTKISDKNAGMWSCGQQCFRQPQFHR